jgi:tetraacyldisaccharide 4'-kinase
LPVFRGRLVPDADVVQSLAGRGVLAFAGIGDPDKFFATLAEAGIDVRDRQAFPDHHRYSAREIEALAARAEAGGLIALTTEKDLARLASEPAAAALAARAKALPVSLSVREADDFRQAIVGVAKRG